MSLLFDLLTDGLFDGDWDRLVVSKATPTALLLPAGSDDGSGRKPGLVIRAKFAGSHGWHHAVILATQRKTLYLARLDLDEAGPIEVPGPRGSKRRATVLPGIWSVATKDVRATSVTLPPHTLSAIAGQASGPVGP